MHAFSTTAPLLLCDHRQVIFSHETNPDYGGYNEPTQWSDAKYSGESEPLIPRAHCLR